MPDLKLAKPSLRKKKNQKPKNILKKNAAQFCKDAAALFARLGFQHLHPDAPSYDRSLRIQTDLGVFIVHPPRMNTWYPSPLEDINGYFVEPACAAAKVDCNPYSGKWNILHSDPATILREFETRMKWIGAHAPTPEESEAWAVQDAVDAAKLAEWRAEMAKITT